VVEEAAVGRVENNKWSSLVRGLEEEEEEQKKITVFCNLAKRYKY
jgi:hypothetical protein